MNSTADLKDQIDTIAMKHLPPAPSELVGAEYGRFWEIDPQEKSESGRTWYFRGQNFVVAYSDAEKNGIFERQLQHDEYIMFLPDRGARAEITGPDGASTAIEGYSITIVPPGASRVRLSLGGRIVRLFTSRAEDLIAKASNASSYTVSRKNIPPLKTWPEPTTGYRVRTYSLDVPPQPGRFGRIFRCTTFMMNCLDERKGPRDITRLSPHHHDDFEQCFLLLEGAYIFSLRWPWVSDMRNWREDEHMFMRAPSATVVPPPAIHTSRAQDKSVNWLVDCFCPPRADFSGEEGWVLNANDYPIPDELKRKGTTK